MIVVSLCFCLIFFPVQVIDKSGGQTSELFEDSKVEKFELSDQAYDERAGTSSHTFLFRLFQD